MGTYKELDVYKRSFQSAVAIYKYSLGMPKFLQFDIADEIRRAARSIPSNIAEGYARNISHIDKKHFLKIAIGSNDEILFNLEFIYELQLIETAQYEAFKNTHITIGKQLYNLMVSLSVDTAK